MINIVHAWNFMYENDHSYELLLFMYDILNHGYERLLIMDDQYWSVHHIMTPKPKDLIKICNKQTGKTLSGEMKTASQEMKTLSDKN